MHWTPFLPPRCTSNTKNTLFGVFSCSTPFLHPRCTPNTKKHPCRCVFVFDASVVTPMHGEHGNTPSLVYFRVRHLSFHPDARRARKNTVVGVFSRSTPFLHPGCTPNTKTHQRRCVFEFGTFSSPWMYAERGNTSLLDVFSCSASFLRRDACRT